jgi:hypothetical protein
MLTRLTSRSRRMLGELLIPTSQTATTTTSVMSDAVKTTVMIDATITANLAMTTEIGIVIGKATLGKAKPQ